MVQQPTIGFAGMTHLGLVSGIAAAEKGFRVVCFDPDGGRIKELSSGALPVSEPQLDELFRKNRERLEFSANAEALVKCDVVYVAPDVATDDSGKSDLGTINALLTNVVGVTTERTTIVVLAQVPPGFTRSKQRLGRSLYYQVETLIFGRAVERALFPERYIVGCGDPSEALPSAYKTFLEAHGCPILPMRYESAELAKISINMFLVASVSASNTLAELCEKIGADWSEIVPSLRLDKRIGPHAYLTPGLGIAGGNLERDLATVCDFADRHHTDAGIVRAWIANSEHRKNWAAETIKSELLDENPSATVAVWGLAYKENTHSVKGSPSLLTIRNIPETNLRLHDPVVPANAAKHEHAIQADSPIDALDRADALMIMTPWPLYREIAPADIAAKMRGRLVLDPYGVLNWRDASRAGLRHITLGKTPVAKER
ncbi:MAG: UDP-glucose/GDP-mannose dehydrogenase family protein [Gemmatimonadaceae bacterium]|nr:UDP-glucose/GDP-mannose dehydrogenase family protein [Gemmatimonadaceae bacterium]MBA3655765.1 UDP-glucose/GDP-mannose dehydrogenase family protein [Gemmatimonadaceae bacterium]